MIRYVVAIILTVAIVALAMAAIDHGAQVKSEQQVHGDVAELEDEATSIYRNDELPPEGFSGPQRTVVLDLPSDDLTSTPIDHFELTRESHDVSVVRFRVGGGSMQEEAIEVPITTVDAPEDTLELTGTGRRDLRLTLVRDDEDRPIVRIERTHESDP